MKKFLPLIYCGCILFFAGCSSEENKNPTGDSAVAVKNDPSVNIIKTDSGRLEIKPISGIEESDAVLYSADGKIVQEGKFFDNKPAGAWLKYDEAGNVVSAYHYSQGKPAHKLDPEDFNFITISKKGFGATFSVPQKWPETPSPDAAHLVAFSKDLKDPSIKLNPNFNFRHEKLHAGDSLHGLSNMQLHILHENVGRVFIIEKSDFVLDGCEATRSYGTFTEESGTVGFLSAIIISGDDVWFFSCEAQNNKEGEFLNYQGVFQRILESFKKVNT
ncbi:MAG: hypothetical protein M3R17_01230 [Bacteroidota bacterium]|nr:hypothetical protein [Bacteroidota bacterium]